MQKYEIIEKAGSGNFSDVYKAKDLRTEEIVAIKQMKPCEDIQELTLKQLKIVASLDHSNIIQLKEVIRQNGEIRIVFEYLNENLLELYQSSKTGVNQNQIKCILYQIAFALEYLHNEKQIIHRDIKPENILIDRKKALVKLIDFGLAKQQYLAITDYVATRWYRSPQNLIGLRKSTSAIDIFALACVIVELFTTIPLFPGEDTIDQLNLVFDFLGVPTQQSWEEGYYEMIRKGINIIQKPKKSLSKIMINASANLIDLLQKMLILNPQKRITAIEIMKHPFFYKVQRVIPDTIFRKAAQYLHSYKNRNKKCQSRQSLVFNTTTVSNRRYSPHQRLDDKDESTSKQKKKSSPKVKQFKINNSIQFPNLSQRLTNSNLYTQNISSKIGQVSPVPRIHHIHNIISPDRHQKRLLSVLNPIIHKRSPLLQRRFVQERQSEVQHTDYDYIKRKTFRNEQASPKQNIKSYKQVNDSYRVKRNVSMIAPNSKIYPHRSTQQAPLPINLQIKNSFMSRHNF